MSSIAEILNRGWQLHQTGNLPAAEQHYRQAIQLVPTDANAWCYLGMACHDQDRWDEAVAAYRRAIQLQPNFPIAFNNLGNTFRLQRRLDEALASFDQALRLKPDYLTAHKNRGTALVWEGRLDEALVCFQQALELDPQDAETHKNLGVIWLLQGQFERGWPEYEWRWKTKEITLPAYRQPLWDGSSLDGRTILLVAEQGLGDAVHFIRYAAVLKQRFACRVLAACPRPLLPLLTSCDGIDVLLAQDDPPPAFDVFAPLLNVPGLLREQLDTIPASVPYLHPDERLVAHWQAELAGYGGVKIGLAWQGNRQHQADRFRSLPLREFLPLAQCHGLQLFSLQKGAGTEQLEALAGRLDIVSLGDRLDESSGAFMDTAAVLQSLDLLITSDTAIAHVAGALNVPVWLALAAVPDWRWLLERSDSPWYPSMRLFRQAAPGDWPSVVQAMLAELPRRFPAVRPKRWDEYRLASSGQNRLVRARHGLLLYNRHDIYIGRSLERYGEYSEGEVELLRQLLRPKSVAVEAGANIGAHTLALSELVGTGGEVHAFEPQRIVFHTLCANVALNSRTNVHCYCEALGDQLGWLVVPEINYDREANFGGLELGGHQTGQRVRLTTVDSLQLSHCQLLKIAVEGMELEVLKGAAQTIAQHGPLLYVANGRVGKSAALIEYLLALGYNLYWHVPFLFSPTNYFGNTVNEFGGLASANMLGIHASIKADIQGLRRITGPQDDVGTVLGVRSLGV